MTQNATMPNVAAARADFPILAHTVHGRPLAYLDNAATTQKPHAVLERIRAHYHESNGGAHRGAHYLAEQASTAYEAARRSVARFIGARAPHEIVFTAGTTDAINLVAHGFSDHIGRGDEIVVTEMEHHSNLVPWQVLCERRDARLRTIPFDADGVLRIDALDTLLTERTRLVALTHVSNVLGTVNPIADVVETAHARGVPVLVDAAQSVPHRPIDVEALDCDFLAFSGHKLYAATGVGVLYGKEEWLERLPPGRFGGGMIDTVELARSTYAGLPAKFEAGTPNVAGAVSLAAAIEYLEEYGLEAIAAHEHELMHDAIEQLGAIDGLRIHGPRAHRCGALAFNLRGVSAYDVAMILDKLGVAVRSGTHCAAPIMLRYGVSGMVRASFALYNTMEDVTQLVAGVRKARTMLL